jgi:hypothetical protein
MGSKTLSKREKAAINSILDDAERNFIPTGNISQDLEALDEQCRGIWTDWDFSVPLTRRTPNRPTDSSHVTPPHQHTSSKAHRVTLVLPDMESSDRHTRTTPKCTNSEEEDEEEPQNPTPPKPTRKPAKQRQRVNAPQRPNKQIPQNTIKQKRAEAPTEPFNRSDAARLRQDNIDLKRDVGRLQAALDRANLEISRLKQEVQRAEQASTKQKTVIRYLKEEKLYGNK